MVSRVPTNIPGLDRHIEGGLVEKSVSVICGGPGTGKTIFCLHLLREAVSRGTKVLFISFEEGKENIEGDAKVFNWDLKGMQEKGRSVFLTYNLMEEINLKYNLLNVIKKKKIGLVLIDSMALFSMMFKDDVYRLRKELYALIGLLKRHNCTVVFTTEVGGEASLDITTGGGSLSRDGIIEFVTDSVITLHNSGIGGKGDRALRILKMRRTNHTKGPIPMEISYKGIRIFK